MKWLPLVLLLLPMAGHAEPARPLPLGVNHAYQGYIDNGGKFGIRVGDDRETARKVLIGQGIRDDGPGTCHRYIRMRFECRDGEALDMYRVQRAGYDGQIFLFTDGRVITAIAWDATLLPNVDL